ncbi:MAG: DNA repair protein RecN [Xanthomonadales bacterium]|nr:DNA repair protein RecN [Xanthomonadales bacterium]
MLKHLDIQNFAIIPSLALDFEPGFTAITGETGAGKSILVDALGLLLGARSDASWVRQGAERAELTAEFEITENPAAAQWLSEAELDDEESCLLRRSIAANGRSRAWINGTPVTVAQLNELGERLVEIHGQNEHVRLGDARQQFRLLDQSGDYADALNAVREAHAAWRELRNRFDALREESALSAEEVEYVGFQLRELEAQALEPDAVATLEQEHKRLASGGAFLQDLERGAALLEDEEAGAEDRLQSALNALMRHRELDSGIKDACDMLDSALINTREVIAAIRHAQERLDLSPERLEAVTAQLSDLGDLARKHRVAIEELPRVRDALAERLAASEGFEARRTKLESDLAAALAHYRAAAAKLSRQRKKHAQRLSADVQELMAELGMAGGVLDFGLRFDPEATPSARGDDAVELQVSANPGIAPGPLAKIASGGELSRISLAIKVAAIRGRGARTQVFDEVDAGIGGDTANAVGKLLARLAGNGQALCVTHLAQVAVCADQQIQVRKRTGADSTEVDTAQLDEAQRVDEIARMLSGKLSDQSRQHAREMLEGSR